ncbi:hypothetical protein HDU80_008976 [Chytriomyces hyalinus]|nr:hypothetical protein HDU80_008976 [Chytriomyces hyalinus]
MSAKSKEGMADGWRKVQSAVNADMEVEYTVEQCKAKVTALKALWSKLKAEEGETGNSEKRTKKPDYFEWMVLYFGNKSGLSGDTLGDAEDGVTISQVDADAKFQRFMASNSRGSVAGSSTSTVSSSGSLAGIDSDTDSLGDTVDGDGSEATSSKTPAKRQKRTEQEEADMMTRESIGLPPAVALKQSETNPSKAEPKPKQKKPDVAGALDNIGSSVGGGLSEMAKAIAGTVGHQADSTLKNVESLISKQSVSQEEASRHMQKMADCQQESSQQLKTIADGQLETSQHLKKMASSQDELVDSNKKLVESNMRVSQMLEQFLLKMASNSTQ